MAELIERWYARGELEWSLRRRPMAIDQHGPEPLGLNRYFKNHGCGNVSIGIEGRPSAGSKNARNGPK